MRRRERRALAPLSLLKAGWRGERWRSVPSGSVVFRYLATGSNAKREAHRAFIPSPNDALKGLGKVNAGLVDFVRAVRLIPGHAGHGRLPGGEPQEGGAVQLPDGYDLAQRTQDLGFGVLHRAHDWTNRVGEVGQ